MTYAERIETARNEQHLAAYDTIKAHSEEQRERIYQLEQEITRLKIELHNVKNTGVKA